MIPKAYHQGFIEFYKLKFKVSPDVLIPRPETELLVDEVFSQVTSYQYPSHRDLRLTIVDVGTGSGCIAISIAKNLPAAKVYGLDISPKALKVAEQNAKLNLIKNITFIESNLLSNLEIKPDIIVANLPYIPSPLINQLDESVRDYEPHLALDGGDDGLRLYDKLFAQISVSFQPRLILCEIDEDQGLAAQKLAQKYFSKAKFEIKKDLWKKDRIILIHCSKID